MSEPTHDRREFLRKVGLGSAVAAGAWVAPQVLFTSTAAAGCTPITKLLQVNATGCTQMTPTTLATLACAPPGWNQGQSDVVSFSCALTGSGPAVTIIGCTPIAGRALKLCPNGSGKEKYSCEIGTVSGNTITFPALKTGEIVQGCTYLEYRITVSCCT